MLTALLLIFDPAATWQRIGALPEHRVSRVFCSYLLPLLILSVAGESFGLLRLGMSRGYLMPRLVKPSAQLVIRYEVVQTIFDLLIIFVGALFLKKMGDSFHRKHTYSQCFVTLGYSLGPLFLVRLLDGVPSVNTWLCYGIGIVLAIST